MLVLEVKGVYYVKGWRGEGCTHCGIVFVLVALVEYFVNDYER